LFYGNGITRGRLCNKSLCQSPARFNSTEFLRQNLYQGIVDSPPQPMLPSIPFLIEDEVMIMKAIDYRFESGGRDEIIGRSFTLKAMLRQVEIVASTDSTVLIQGETGTGKELVARAIHRLSPRHCQPFITVNCSAIPAGLLESDLFGHERGAFTGATIQRLGRFELAHKGTLFLDEVGDLPLELQPKLLRVLQEQEFQRLGGARNIRVNVRLVAATNKDLMQMVEEKLFRSDLYYRLNIFPVTVPSLRERVEDIPLLVHHFVDIYAKRMGKRIEQIAPEMIAAFTRYDWPGNVRELQNVIERAVILSSGTALKVLPGLKRSSSQRRRSEPENGPDASSDQDRIVRILGDLLRRAVAADAEARKNGAPAEADKSEERKRIEDTLRETGGRVGGPNGAATRLGLKRTTLITRMKKLGIDPRSVV
jgi:formate hydrogenlyase transcriptional activator